jgi:hypothetical protein
VALTEAQLAFGADHPVGDMAVGLPGGDRESPRQHRPGQRDDDESTGLGVRCATDDPPRLVLADVHRTPADGLAVLLRLGLAAENPADDERAAHLRPVDLLDLQPAGHGEFGEGVDGHLGRGGNELPQPGHRDTHDETPDSAGFADIAGARPAGHLEQKRSQAEAARDRANRTSPSTMSCMSEMPCRNISVRSIPIPKANPL